MADLQTGFGPFVSLYLAAHGWFMEHVSFALTAGGLSGVAAQLPGGALTDTVRRKRLLVAIGILMIAASAILLALWPNFRSCSLLKYCTGLPVASLVPRSAPLAWVS